MGKAQEVLWDRRSELWISSLENYGQCLSGHQLQGDGQKILRGTTND